MADLAPDRGIERVVRQLSPRAGAYAGGLVLADDVLAELDVAGRRASRLSPCVSSSFAVTASWSFSQTRGTAKNTVGRQSRRSSATVDRLRANQVSAPTATDAKSLIMRSAMWLSGRNDSSRSPSRCATATPSSRCVHMMLAWLTIAPLGGPVVPLVYTSVARCPGQHRVARVSKRSGSRCEPRRADGAQLRESRARTDRRGDRRCRTRRSGRASAARPSPRGSGPRVRGPRRSTRGPRRARGCTRPARTSWSGRRARSRCRWRGCRDRRGATRRGCSRRSRRAGPARCRARRARR